ncbi:hypothetical protein [Agrobacterium sp. SORGH_AS 787]|uniref:hypothetical protein n=1 Tax=Agrobacterium sp. SORGH_AS 787 TaxID=3041775 RepID=UPI002782ADB9|nr:hypothetical protein [Rhizobium sp. SORGH_AS_0787]
MDYAIKTEIYDTDAVEYRFPEQKTMYGGKHVKVGDTIYLFASENEGGFGLVARGTVISVVAVPRKANVARQTPRVTLEVKTAALSLRPLGRRELARHKDWDDGAPETELNFKFYRQATNKVVGLSDSAAAFLNSFFQT